MSTSLKRHEGYMMIDNRNSPGVPDEVLVKQGLPPGAGQGLYESATYTCSHCQSVIVMEPKRTRPRAYCGKCDQRICDACEFIRTQTLECHTMNRVIDNVLELASRGLDPEPAFPLFAQTKE